MKNTWIILALLFAYASAGAQEKYTIEGNLTSYRKPTKIFIFCRDGDRNVQDSTLITDGKFKFHIDLTAPTVVYLSTRPEDPSASEGVDCMPDPGLTLIEGETLRKATISGGENHALYLTYKQRMAFVGDSVYQSWKASKSTLPADSAAAFQVLINAQRKNTGETTRAFMLAHPDSYVSLFLLQQNTVILTEPEFFDPVIQALSPSFAKLPHFMAVAERIAIAKELGLGKQAMSFSQTDDKGKVISLSDLKGKYVLVDFWASWCGPCRAEYPYLKKAYTRFKNKNFEIVGISLDDKKENWLNAIRSNGFEWIQLSDLKGRDNEVAKAYGVAAIPQNFLIDPQGNIIAKNLRGEQLEEKLVQVIR